MKIYKLVAISFLSMVFIAYSCNKREANYSDLPQRNNFNNWLLDNKNTRNGYYYSYLIDSYYLNSLKQEDVDSYYLSVRGAVYNSSKDAIFVPYRENQVLPPNYLWTVYSATPTTFVFENNGIQEVLEYIYGSINYRVSLGPYTNEKKQEWSIYGVKGVGNSFYGVIVNKNTNKILEVSKLEDDNDYFGVLIDRNFSKEFDPNNKVENPDGIMDIMDKYPELVFQFSSIIE